MSEQGTQEWRDERAGMITASRISDVLAKPRRGQPESIGRRNYRAQLVCERMTGKAVEDQFESWDMKLGIKREPIARAEYEIKQGVIVDTAGFVQHPTIPRAGCSPDGLVGTKGLVQFKCPKSATHLDWRKAKIVPTEHVKQMLFELSCYPEREWSELVSYEPHLPEKFQLFIARLKRDNVAIAEMENEVRKFDAEIEDIIANLTSGEDEDLTDILQESVKLAESRRGISAV